MRLVMALALVGSLVARTARADDDKPRPPHHHPAAWYSGWSLIAVGGVSTVLGAALTTREDSASSTTGWVLAGVGTATWVGGALMLRLMDKRTVARALHTGL